MGEAYERRDASDLLPSLDLDQLSGFIRDASSPSAVFAPVGLLPSVGSLAASEPESAAASSTQIPCSQRKPEKHICSLHMHSAVPGEQSAAG